MMRRIEVGPLIYLISSFVVFGEVSYTSRYNFYLFDTYGV
jgi:hypothetical protein